MAAADSWKGLLVAGIILSLVAFILGWIGFGVPDWHKFQRYTNSPTEYYGLWAYCQEQPPLYDSVCKRWSTAADQLFNGSRPNFIRTSEGLITTGMILLSLGLFVAILAAVLPYLAYLAALLALLAFIFLVIGLPIFGRQSNNYSASRGDVQYNKRYGFWLIVPTIVLEFLAALLFLAAGAAYNKMGFGNLATGMGNKSAGYAARGGNFNNRGLNFGNTAYGGRQVLGPPNVLNVPPPLSMPSPVNIPYGLNSPSLYGSSIIGPDAYGYSPSPNRAIPSLLSQYLAQRSPLPYGPTVVRSSGLSALPAPSISRAVTSSPIPNVTPAYLRMGDPVGPQFQPIINLSGETIIGPIQRTS